MSNYKNYFLFFFFLFPLANNFSQTPQPPAPTLQSPYHAIQTHLYYLQPDSYQPAISAKAFQLADTVKAQRLAIQLKQVLDGKGLFVHMNLLPQAADYRDSLTQKPFYTPFPQQLPEVYLEKTDSLWHYSQQTAEAIPGLHRSVYPFGTDFLVNLFPHSSKWKFLGLAAWQWAGAGLLLVLAWLLQILLSRLFRPIVRRLAKSRYSSPLDDKGMLFKVARLASFVLLLWGAKMALPLLQLPVKSNAFLINGLEIAGIIMAVMFGLSIIDVIMQYAFRYATSTEHKLDEQLIPILRRMMKILVVIGGVIYVLQLLDVNVTALIAGVSIGGLALALVAQDTVKNLIGSAMIFFDKPFQIGDWVVMGSTEGEVVEVGFRSTRLLMVDTSIITVPNNVVASGSVTNMGIRKMRLFKTTLGVTYDTPPILLRKFIEGLRKIIERHEHTKKENFLVYFNNFGDSSLQIYFRTHLLVNTIAEELRIKEELSFDILQLAEALGVRFAFPTQTLFIEEIPGKGNTTPFYEKDSAKLDEVLERYFGEGKTGSEPA